MRLHWPGLSRHKSASGWKYRVRQEGNRDRRVTLPCGPEHPEFGRCYREARQGMTPALDTPPQTIPHSLEWLGRAFEAHMAAQVKAGQLAPDTARYRSAYLARLYPAHGEKHMAMPRAKLLEIRDDMAETPGAADTMVKTLRALYAWAMERGHVSENPAAGIGKLSRGTGAVPWSIDDLAQFRAHHPAGTMAHLALTLLTFTACRAGDAYRLGRAHERVRESVTWLEWQPAKKGSAFVSLPVMPPLMAAIRAQTVVGPTYLLNAHGKPFASVTAFGNWFRDRVREAGLEGRSPHGIRKAAGELLALQGATQYEIMAIHGHTQAHTSERYTAGVNRSRLASQAMQRLGDLEW
jgi:integrase